MPAAKKNKPLEYTLGVEVIKKYMQKRDIPDWFRGISNFQVSAANNLFEALLYDGEQRSTHRVRACLTSLGLKPMIPTDKLKKIMFLSRGNDLAFLWILLESNYKSKGPGYSINEQILYSAIAHLDMVTTLRELDRLLPHNPPKERKVPKTNKQHIIVKPDQFKQFKISKNDRSPYLEPIKTRNLYHQPIELKRPDPKLSMGEYEIYKDPNYVVRNESNRWFASYVTKTSRRIVSCILRDEIEKIVDNAGQIDDKFIACEYHKRLREAEIKLKHDLEEKARADIQRYFDVDGVRDEHTKKRILEQIERDVRMLMQKSRYDTEKIYLDPKKTKQKIEIVEGLDSIRYCVPKTAEDSECKEGANKTDLVMEEEPLEDKFKSDENISISKNRPCVVSLTTLCGVLKKNHECDWFTRPFCKTNANQKNPFSDSDRFFKASQKHKPYTFDYQKIFNIDHSKPTREESVKLSFFKVLSGNMSPSPDITGNIDIEKAFNIGFKKQWSESVEEYNRKMDQQPKIEKTEEIPLPFDREYFDPNDIPYMVYMLKCCFDHMKKNPKFVLASLPDAHKLPLFLYFIQDRYGKRYSFKERQAFVAESLRILRALEKLTKVAPLPNISEFSTAPDVSYSCRNYLIAKSEKIRRKYYDQLDQIIMHQARIFWFAMRPYLRSSGPPRNTYFDYMPPTTVNIKRFRQWKSTEYMDAKSAWYRRQKQGSRY